MSYKTDELRFKVYAKHGDMCDACERMGAGHCASRLKPEDYVLVSAFAYLQEAIYYAQKVSSGDRGVNVRLRSANYGEASGYSVSEYSPKGVRLAVHEQPEPVKAKRSKAPRFVEDKRLVQDKQRALRSLETCVMALTNPFFVGTDNGRQTQAVGDAVREAILSAMQRTRASLLDPRMLWNTYRRLDKGKPYFQAEYRSSRLLPPAPVAVESTLEVAA